MKCPKCHFDNPPDTVYCGNCATPLEPPKEISVSPTKTLQVPLKELEIGSVFVDRYEVLEKLGKGGMGKVYKALDKEINDKDDALIHSVCLSEAYAAKGLYDQAQDVLEFYLNNFSDRAVVRWYLARNYLFQGKYKLALREVDRAFSLDPALSSLL